LPAQRNRLILIPVRVLSNLLGGANASAWVYRPAQQSEIPDALSLVLGSPAAPADANQVADFTQFAGQRGIDLTELWVAGVGDQLGWAVLPIYSPGRTALVLTPSQPPRGGDMVALIDRVCQAAGTRGVHLAQVLAEPGAVDMQRVYGECGFQQIAELLYLQSAIRRAPAPPRLPDGCAWHTYGEQTHSLFCRVIASTYMQSLDCPALSGLRDIEDIVAGHRASGEFDPRHWFALTRREEPVGVALLTRVPRVEMAELVYLGLTPEARGQGLGDVTMKQALWGVSQMGLQRLTLAVDSRNAPALKLYYRHGLGHIGSKTAMLRDLRVKTRIDSVPPK
jgi:mycothiol synthase